MYKFLLSGLLLSLPCMASAASDTKPQTQDVLVKPDTYSIVIGAFYANSDSYMVVTNPRNGGTFPLDFEDDLNLKEKQFLPYFEFIWNFNERHNLYVDWKSLHRTAVSPEIQKDFQFNLN